MLNIEIKRIIVSEGEKNWPRTEELGVFSDQRKREKTKQKSLVLKCETEISCENVRAKFHLTLSFQVSYANTNASL